MKVEFYRQRDAFPHTRKDPGTPDEIVISVHSEDVSNYEFVIAHVGTEARYVGDPIGVQVRVFDDGWRAFTDLPELFQALSANDQEHRSRNIDLDDLTQILLALDYEDVTQRYAEGTVHVQGCLTCGEVHA